MVEAKSTAELVVYGAGGHGKVVADILLSAGKGIKGFLDDFIAPGTSVFFGLPVLGDNTWLQGREGIDVALGIGDNVARAKIVNDCIGMGGRIVQAVHPSAVIATTARMGRGVVVMAGAILNPDCRIEEGAILNSGVIVEHDVLIGKYAHLSPNAATGGACNIGAFTHVGLGASILPRVQVGERCQIGAGAAVTTDLPNGVVAAGVPARIIRKTRAE